MMHVLIRNELVGPDYVASPTLRFGALRERAEEETPERAISAAEGG